MEKAKRNQPQIKKSPLAGKCDVGEGRGICKKDFFLTPYLEK